MNEREKSPHLQGQREEEERERLEREAAAIDELLGELAEMTGPPAWQRIEELVARLVSLYGSGLERLLGHFGDEGVLSPELQERLVADETVSSLLLVHGLHPHPLEERVRRAVEWVKSQRDTAALEIEVLRAEPEVVELKLSGAAARSEALEARLRRAVAEAAPEVERIEIQGATSPDPEPLVTIDLSRSRGGGK